MSDLSSVSKKRKRVAASPYELPESSLHRAATAAGAGSVGASSLQAIQEQFYAEINRVLHDVAAVKPTHKIKVQKRDLAAVAKFQGEAVYG